MVNLIRSALHQYCGRTPNWVITEAKGNGIAAIRLTRLWEVDDANAAKR